MNSGFIRVAAATPQMKLANCAFNAKTIVSALAQLSRENIKLVVFPELSVTGATCGDLFLQSSLIKAASDALSYILKNSENLDIIAVLGLPIVKDGRLYDCAAVIHKGKVLAFIPKTYVCPSSVLLRNFSGFAEENSELLFGDISVPFGSKLLIEVKELPSFVLGVEFGSDLFSPASMSYKHSLAGATVIACLSSEPEIIGSDYKRRTSVSAVSEMLSCAYIYANSGEGESSTDNVYSSHNLISEAGTILNESQLFGKGLAASEIDTDIIFSKRKSKDIPVKEENYKKIYTSIKITEAELIRKVSSLPFIPQFDKKRQLSNILLMQASGLARRMKQCSCEKLVIGVSGGLDSTLALLASVKTMDKLSLPRSNILAISMPCFGTTSRTKNNAEVLINELGASFRLINITETVKKHFSDISHDESNYDHTYENAQARIRTCTLMDIANSENALVVGTGDLSELALGWATYNGDHMSMYSVNASIPKTLIKEIVKYEASVSDEKLKNVLLDILDTPISPELLPSDENTITQKTESFVGDYELNDFFLYYVLNYGFSPSKIYLLAKAAFADKYKNGEILHWLNRFYSRFFSQQFKRSCMPDGPKVTLSSLSPRGAFIMPSDADPQIWKDELKTLE